jgi:hypothetical protein
VAIAREIVAGLLKHVEQAASVDPRPSAKDNPMQWHRQRIHPALWDVLEKRGRYKASDPVPKERKAWQAHKHEAPARRPIFSPVGAVPPGEGPTAAATDQRASE